MELLILLVVVAAAGGVWWWYSQQRSSSSADPALPPTTGAPWSVGPTVLEFHIQAQEAQVVFDTKLSEKDDPVLIDMLVGEAIEVVRDKSDHLPIGELEKVVVYVGSLDGAPIGERAFSAPGRLPPQPIDTPLRVFTREGSDPLDRHFDPEEQPDQSTPPPTSRRSTALPPISAELSIPASVERGLRLIGIDTESMSAGELMVGTLRLTGYRLETGPYENSQMAHKEGTVTLLWEDRYIPEGHQVVEEKTLRSFMARFAESGADRGVLISDKYSPFQIYEMEQRQPKCRFLTRERLQKIIDGLALSGGDS